MPEKPARSTPRRKKSEDAEMERVLFLVQLKHDILFLHGIMREVKWDPLCVKTKHKYGFCTQCTQNEGEAQARFMVYKEEHKKKRKK